LLELLPGLKFVDLSGNPFNGTPAHPLTEGASAALALTEASSHDDALPRELEAPLGASLDAASVSLGAGSSGASLDGQSSVGALVCRSLSLSLSLSLSFPCRRNPHNQFFLRR
jgi:hypothetical protein